MARKYNERNVTSAQSTLDISTEVVFLFDNKYQSATFLNNTGAALDLEQGILVRRDIANAGQVIPAIAGATLANVIGVLRVTNAETLAIAGTAKVSYAIQGELDSGLLVLPAGVTLDTTVGAKHLKDILTGIGFDPRPVTELTSYDN